MTTSNTSSGSVETGSVDTGMISTPDGAMAVHVAKPNAAKAPGIVLIQEIFGINKVMKQTAQRLAEAGFVVACPDLFWRIEPGIDLDDHTEAGMKRAFELFGIFDADKGMQDIAATIAWLRHYPQCNGKAGAIGYCLGGKLAYLTATRTDVDASVGYYGVMIDQLLGEAGNIKKPLMLHIAGKDQFVSPEAQAAIHKGLAAHAHVTLHDYPGEEHAFARINGEHYSAQSAPLADRRTIDFLNSHLG
jgi:carboxymethylenebutenolidase